MAEPTPKCLFCGVKIQKTKEGYQTFKPLTIETKDFGTIHVPGGGTASETWEHDPEHVAARRDFHSHRIAGMSYKDLELVDDANSIGWEPHHPVPLSSNHLVEIDDAVEKELGHVPMPDTLGDDHMGRQFKE